MIENELLKQIQGRRSVLRFKTTDVSEEHVEAILEAGRWAPSYINSQPWEFIVVRDAGMKERVADVLKRVTVAWQSFAAVPLFIVVAVDTAADPYHYIEDGSAAAQNMALMAHSLGLASFWAGIRSERLSRRSPEAALQALLGVPRHVRLVAALPVGVPAYTAESARKPLPQMLHRERYP